MPGAVAARASSAEPPPALESCRHSIMNRNHSFFIAGAHGCDKPFMGQPLRPFSPTGYRPRPWAWARARSQRAADHGHDGARQHGHAEPGLPPGARLPDRRGVRRRLGAAPRGDDGHQPSLRRSGVHRGEGFSRFDRAQGHRRFVHRAARSLAFRCCGDGGAGGQGHLRGKTAGAHDP